MEGTTRRRRAPETRREEILRAASRLFGEQGYERTTTKQIAREAGIAEGTIYKYFASKQDLLFAFLESSVIEPLAAILAAMKDAPDEDVFATLIQNRIEMWDASHEFMKVTFAEALFNPQLAARIHDKLFSAGTRIIGHYVDEGISDGRFRSLDTAVVLRAIIGSLFAFTIMRDITGPVTAPRDSLARELARFFLTGIRAPRAAAAPAVPALPFALLW
jgi:AcrR family transcriptional regulator